MRLSIQFAIVFTILAGCGRDEELVTLREPPETPSNANVTLDVPRKIDRGDGCFVDVLAEGSGRALAAGDEAILAYEARVCGADVPFASTRGSLEPFIARLDPSSRPALIPGLVRGLIGLTIGTKARIEVPPELAYGKGGLPAAGIPADASLVFDVEVLGAR